ncbi:hypothetical protein CAAN1_06S02982 [[Candida] anglica]|uniref:Retrotransposon gag domain-containing protein n=1 Tax=[Candida] anglica TaxID=148631 RepID=A0ABP0EN76_9ASCO
MTIPIESLRFLRDSIHILHEQNIEGFLEWVNVVETNFKLIGAKPDVAVAISRLSGSLLSWAQSYQFESWESFRYQLFNHLHPFRVTLANTIRPEVNTIKQLLENHSVDVFSYVEKFHLRMVQIHTILSFEEKDIPSYSTIPEIDSIQDLVYEFRHSRIERFKLFLKDEEAMTEEEEDQLLELMSKDEAADKFWDGYRHFVETLTYQSLLLGLSTKGEVPEKPITIGKLSKKILKNL